MERVKIRYHAHFSELAENQLEEELFTESKTVGELISELDQKYPGFREALFDSLTGELNLRNQILEVTSEATNIADLKTKIVSGNIYAFW